MKTTPFKLKPHQEKAITKLGTGKILLGSVGSGKSLTSLAYIYTKICGGLLGDDPKIPKKSVSIYVITTARKRDSLDWIKEAAYLGINRDEANSIGGITIHVDSWNNIKKYTGVKNCFFIFDEQRLVGYGAWVKAFLKISKKNDWLLLTATPGDRWLDYIPVFIANGYYKDKTDFVRQHVVYNSFVQFPKVDRYINTNKLEMLRQNLIVKMVFKREVKTHHKSIFVEFDIDDMDLVIKKRWNPYDEKPIVNSGELCYLSRRVANSSPSRVKAIENLAKKYRRLIVFYNFNYELYALRELKGSGFSVSEYNGHKHEPIPEASEWIYLVQYTSGAEAWNCIDTNVIVFYSPNYSYKTLVQAAGRIDRLNSPYTNLYYYHIRTNALIDKSIRDANNKKTDFNEQAFVKKLASQ